MLVVIDEPQVPAWGAAVAAPVFREVGAQVLRHLRIPPQRGVDVQMAAVGNASTSMIDLAHVSE